MLADKNQELDRLSGCLERIDVNLHQIGARLGGDRHEIKDAHEHMWEHRPDMDHIDKSVMCQSIDQMSRPSLSLRAPRAKLEKLRKSPYFAGFDFRRTDRNETETYYIGIHDFRDEEPREPWV
ncbi:MAG: hypothetical protein COW29_10475 [Rhodobacterales bacterium CG15_BIG_FIL_POST_REV_8_21_14_020_59_13]|nr:MAG: hypothetical protein COW29_10475 [Rhodobacterales bacterium CG15_BIG_FIL_POST_REV_8_21_14_020_59_13]